MSCCEEYETIDDYTYSKDSSVEIKTCIVCFCSPSYHYLMMGSNLDQCNHEREVNEEMFSHSHLSHLVALLLYSSCSRCHLAIQVHDKVFCIFL
mmetsp:Transcript_10237/g.16919  ORF Transcript_10237/g.16919 Transcript_10237/m.16919 type:complete len:94 (+) Transcript_10237:978-1259(+)